MELSGQVPDVFEKTFVDGDFDFEEIATPVETCRSF
jgi:hypothetical protein